MASKYQSTKWRRTRSSLHTKFTDLDSDPSTVENSGSHKSTAAAATSANPSCENDFRRNLVIILIQSDSQWFI